jgi:hypothetical protein
MGRSMSTPSLPTLVEDFEPPDSPTFTKHQLQDPIQMQKAHPGLPPSMLQHGPPPLLHQLNPPAPFIMPSLYDTNHPPNFHGAAITPFTFPAHFGSHPMGFHMPLHIMHGGMPLELHHSIHNPKPLNVDSAQLCNSNEKSAMQNAHDKTFCDRQFLGTSAQQQQVHHLVNWAPMDPAMSHRLGYELMMRMRENNNIPSAGGNMHPEHEANNASAAARPDDFPEEETASSWQKTDDEEVGAASDPAADKDTAMHDEKDFYHSADAKVKEGDTSAAIAPPVSIVKNDNSTFFKPMSFQGNFMYGQFPVPFSAFDPSRSFMRYPPPSHHPHPYPHQHTMSNLHSGILRPTPSMAPISLRDDGFNHQFDENRDLKASIPGKNKNDDNTSANNNSNGNSDSNIRNNSPPLNPSPLSLKLRTEDGQERQSAFHSKPNFGSSVLTTEPREVSSPISVV